MKPKKNKTTVPVTSKKRGDTETPAIEPKPKVGLQRLHWIIIGLCLAAALTIRIFVFLDVKPLPDVTSDGVFYQQVAQKITEGTYWKEKNVFNFSPLYVVYLAALREVTGSGINAVRLSQLVIGLGSITLIFLIARAFLSRRASLIALGMASLYLPFIFFEVQVLGVTLALFLLLLSTYLLVSAISRGSWILLALAGWSLGLASLGAPNLVIMGAPAAIWLLFFAEQKPGASVSSARIRKPLRNDLIRTAIFSATVIAGVLPATLWNYHASGQLIPISSQGGINFYIGNNAHATGYFTAPPGMEDSLIGINIKDSQRVAEADAGHPLKINEVSSYWFGKGLHFILSDPVSSAELMFRKIFLYFNHYETPLDVDFDSFKTYSAALRLPLVSFGGIAIFGLAGLVLACRSFSRYSLLILSFATYSLTVIAFFVSDRYRLPAVPFLILFSALGIDWAWEHWQKGRLGTASLGAALLIPIFLFVYAPVGYEASPASLYFNLAVSYLNQKDFPKAKEEFEKCVKADPTWLEARFHLAAVDHELHDNEGAWTQMAQLDGARDLDVLYLRGQLDAESGLLASAQKNFEAILAINPAYAETAQKLADVKTRIAAETPDARRDRGQRLLKEGGQWQQNGQHQRALIDLVELRDGNFEGVDMAFINTALGVEYTQIEHYDDAEKAFEAALVLSPMNALIHKNLAFLEIKRGDRVKAQSHFEWFSRLAPNDPQVPLLRDALSEKPTTPNF